MLDTTTNKGYMTNGRGNRRELANLWSGTAVQVQCRGVALIAVHGSLKLGSQSADLLLQLLIVCILACQLASQDLCLAQDCCQPALSGIYPGLLLLRLQLQSLYLSSKCFLVLHHSQAQAQVTL